MDSIKKKLYVGYTVSHNCSVAIFNEEGQLLSALSEERLSRKKLHAGYPWLTMQYMIDHYGQHDWVLCFARLNSLQRILRTLHFQSRSFLKGLKATPPRSFLKKVLFQLTKEQKGNGFQPSFSKPTPDHYVDHHEAHAASAYFLSGLEECEIMTLDGVGNYLSCTFSEGSQGCLKRKATYFHNEVTIGADYEVVTGMLGFDPLRHPGKITGLAAYGQYNETCIEELAAFLKNNWNGKETSFFLSYLEGNDLDRKRKGLEQLRSLCRTRFGHYRSEDLAYAIQHLTEEKTKELIRKHIPHPEDKNIALAGGVFANVKLNQRIQEMGFQNVFVQPAMDDGGLALGAPLSLLGQERKMRPYQVPTMYLGPRFDDDAVREALDRSGLRYQEFDSIEEKTAELIAEGKVVGRFNGPLEFGPRALGNRSILYQATDKKVNDWLNKRLGRTEFMPFAPVTLAEEAPHCFKNLKGIESSLRFMTITVDCTDWTQRTTPAIVHVDGTARPQLILENDNSSYYRILKHYFKLTGIPTLVNTSFNMHEEPIVATPDDAIRAFVQGRLDCLAINRFLVVN